MSQNKDSETVPGKRWSAEEKVRVVSQAAGLRGAELGAFMRSVGLFEADLQRFSDEVKEAAVLGLKSKKSRKRGASPELKRIKMLERELKRKEKALAEVAALLVLRKKADAFLLGEEEGDTDERKGS